MSLIYLIGYMGSGKSTVGKLLASQLKYDFVDLDQLIEERSGQSIPDLFTHFGEQEFRKIEASAIHQSTLMKNKVIATGGGAPCFYDNLDHMSKVGRTIYLKGSAELLVERITKDTKNVRPLVASKTVEELERFVHQHLGDRRAFYEKTEIVVEVDQQVEEIVEQIIDVLKASSLGGT